MQADRRHQQIILLSIGSSLSSRLYEPTVSLEAENINIPFPLLKVPYMTASLPVWPQRQNIKLWPPCMQREDTTESISLNCWAKSSLHSLSLNQSLSFFFHLHPSLSSVPNECSSIKIIRTYSANQEPYFGYSQTPTVHLKLLWYKHWGNIRNTDWMK